MRCDQVEAVLVEYASDELPPAQIDRIEEHLASCAGCRDSAAGLRRLLDMMWETPAIEPTDSELAAARLVARQVLTAPAARRRAFAPLGRVGDWAFGLASVLVLALAIAVQEAFSGSGFLKGFLVDTLSHPLVLAVCLVSIAVVSSFLPICLLRKGTPNGAYNGL